VQGFGEKGTPSNQRYEHPFIVIAYCDPYSTRPRQGTTVVRIKRHDGRTRIRGAVFFEPDYGSADTVDFFGSGSSSIAAAEFIIANSKIAKVFDIIGSRDFPVAFPSNGLAGTAFETRDLADGVEITLNLVTPSVKGRFSVTACLVPDQRLTMEEWHNLSSQFNIDEISALQLGNL
jgi:hypothetical protein